MRHYERVRFVDGDRERTVILRVTRESERFLCGVEVDKSGDEIAGPGFDERTRLIEHACIVKRVPCEWDLKYGELVPVKPAREVK
jgi:hypothetical protein